MRFTVIDFETANFNRHSACAVGIAVVNDDKISFTNSWLIKPHVTQMFTENNIKIHGITPQAVEKSQEFDKVYSILKQHIAGKLVVAHNALFDVSVLNSSLVFYGIAVPEYEYLCSCELARKAWPALENHKLDTVCRCFNHEFNHHDAASDAIAGANIIIRLMADKKTADIRKLAAIYGEQIQKVDANTKVIIKEHKIPRQFLKRVNAKDIKATVNTFDEKHPAFGKRIAFTGDFKSMSREALMVSVKNLGGIPLNSVTLSCDYLAAADDKLSGKMKQAIAFNEKGKAKIKIINEDELLKLIN